MEFRAIDKTTILISIQSTATLRDTGIRTHIWFMAHGNEFMWHYGIRDINRMLMAYGKHLVRYGKHPPTHGETYCGVMTHGNRHQTME